jgi:hypothetical protein
MVALRLGSLAGAENRHLWSTVYDEAARGFYLPVSYNLLFTHTKCILNTISGK